MDALEQFLGGGQAVAEPPKKAGGKIPSDVQAKRDQDALAIIKEELRKNQELAAKGDKNARLNVAALNREIARFEKKPLATAKAAPIVQSGGDPLESFLSGKPVIATSQTTSQVPQEESTTGTQEGTMGAYVPRRQPVSKVRQIIGNVLKQGFETRQQLGEKAAGVLEPIVRPVYEVGGTLLGGAVGSVLGPAGGVISTIQSGKLGTPEGIQIGQQKAEDIQRALTPEITTPTAKTVLGGLQKGFEATKLPPNIMPEVSGFTPLAKPAAQTVIAPVAKAAEKIAEVAKQTKLGQQLTEAAKDLEIVRPGQLSKAEAQAQFEAKQAPAGSAGAAAVEQNPFAGKITGEETARGNGIGAVFPQVKLTKIPKDVPIEEQKLRSQLFQEVLPDLKPRPGVVTGNDNLLRNEHGLANMAEPSPLGLKLKEQIANEQVGFSNYAQERVNATGARKTFTNDEQRGNFLNDVAYGKNPDDLTPSSLTGYLNQVKQDTYDSAFKNAGNNKINTAHIDDLFVNPQEVATFKAAGTSQLLDAAKDLINEAKTAGFKLPNGEVAAPGSVAAYDRVRKIFNSPRVWSPEKAESIRTINQAIDKDIAAVADPAMYKLGDKIHQVEKTILGSTGFKRLFGEVDANGNVTSKVAPEKMLSSLNNLRKDEWRHIRDTFSELANGRVRGAPEGLPPVPQELRQAAAAAVAEMDGALAREVYKAGAKNVGEWNSNAVNNMLTSVVGEKILETFPPSEIRKFNALNYVGQFTPGLKYEGAGQQARRISLLEKNYPAVGATIGSGLGAIIGETPLSKEAALGGFLGREAGAYLQTKKAAKEEAKAVKKMEKEMEKAKKLGQQSGQNKLTDLNK